MRKWIDCNQEMPHPRAVVLTYREGYMEVAVYRGAPSAPKFSTHAGQNLHDVSHWMRLPAPPVDTHCDSCSIGPEGHEFDCPEAQV